MNRGTATRAQTRLPSGGFTLIELLVVITIIGILAALITVGAVGALKHSRRVTIKSEIEQLDAAFEQMKQKYGDFPPNCQVTLPTDPSFVHNNLVRYMKKVALRHRESEALLWNLTGPGDTDVVHFPRGAKTFGIRPSEAIVFWLGGFSDDPNYPISGRGGPSYIVAKNEDPNNRTLDPIESRKRFYPFDVSRLGPRGPDGFFEDDPRNHIEYLLNGQWHRINFWTYTAPRSDQPYLYFDVSRGNPDVTTTDVPQVTWFTGGPEPWIYPLKQVLERDASGAPLSFKFANQGKFQILHCGIDNSWGDHITHLHKWPSKVDFKPYPGPEYQNFLRLDIDGDGNVSPEERKGMIVFPEGPWIDDIGDTQVNFTTEMTVEDAQH